MLKHTLFKIAGEKQASETREAIRHIHKGYPIHLTYISDSKAEQYGIKINGLP